MLPDLRQIHRGSAGRMLDLPGGGDFAISDPSSSSSFALPPESMDASLRDMLAPLVAESLRAHGRLAPPRSLELSGVFAAVSAVSSGVTTGCTQSDSHFVSAIQCLAQRGFRRCSVVVDKLGVSIGCMEELDAGHCAEQVDFQWSSICDVQDPRLKPGLQGCAVTLGIREPTRLFEGPRGALALVLRLPNRESARSLADASLAFKAYEAQTVLWHACTASSLVASTQLLLDECGCAFWSTPDSAGCAVEAAKVHMEPFVYVEHGAPPETTCCNMCWC